MNNINSSYAYNMDKNQKYNYRNKKKQVTEEYIQCDSIYIKSKVRQNKSTHKT